RLAVTYRAMPHPSGSTNAVRASPRARATSRRVTATGPAPLPPSAPNRQRVEADENPHYLLERGDEPVFESCDQHTVCDPLGCLRRPLVSGRCVPELFSDRSPLRVNPAADRAV